MKKLILWSLLFFLFLGIAGGTVLVFWLKDDFKAGRALDQHDIPYAIILTDRHDTELYRTFDNQNREWVNLSKIPTDLQKITLLMEDRRFFQHIGIDPIGIIRALKTNIASGYKAQGASTITQQIARKAFLYDEKTMTRKLREMAIALGIESKLSKHDILEMYLNVAPYGPTLAGVKGASEYYFEKDLQDLSHAEMLVIASLPKNPVLLARKRNIKDWLGTCPNKEESCTPFDTPLYEKSRIEKILFAFAEHQQWETQYTQSVWNELKLMQLPARKRWVDDDYLHWRFYVTSFLTKKNIELIDYPGGLRIKTSIDKSLQDEIYAHLRSGVTGELLEQYNIENTAIMVLDNATRSPLVWIGSKQFWNEGISGQIDILQSHRQIGSTMKPFIYGMALEEGYDPNTTFWDTRVRFNGERKIITNSDDYYYGAISLQDALGTSRNVPAAQALYLAGGEKKVRAKLDQAYGFGINKRYKNHKFGWTLSLGTAPIPLKTLTNAYATLATGKKQSLCPILQISTTTGKTLPNPCDTTKIKTVPDDVRFLISDILGNQYVRPFGRWEQTASLSLKTGTSTKTYKGELYPVDNIVVGYSPHMTVMTWGGNTDGRHLNQGTFGATSMGPIWKDTVLKTFSHYPQFQGAFEPTDNVRKEGDFWVREGTKKTFKIPGMSFVSKEENARRKKD